MYYSKKSMQQDFDNFDNYDKVYNVKRNYSNWQLFLFALIISLFTIAPIFTNLYVVISKISCIDNVNDIFTTLFNFLIISAVALSLFLFFICLKFFRFFDNLEYIYNFIISLLLLFIISWNCVYGIIYWLNIQKIDCDSYFKIYIIVVSIYQFIESIIYTIISIKYKF